MRRFSTLIFVVIPIALVLEAMPGQAEPVARVGKDKPIKSVGPDVPPEIPASVYRARRERLMKRLGGCTAAIRSKASSGESDLGFDPDFFYLTGVDEPKALLLLSPRQIDKHNLFLTPLDPEREVWTGYRDPISPELRKAHAMDVVRRVRGRGGRYLSRALRQSRCYAHLTPAYANNPAYDAKTLSKFLTSFRARSEQKWELLESMRSIKDGEEIKRMEKAIAITLMGHRAAMRNLRPGATERLVASRIEDEFYAYGATGLAFPSIVASGPNGAILHWVKRSRRVVDGDLVVVDIGASYGGYAADITRTYPVSGSFTPEQRKIYDAVLAAQNKVIAAVRPGISLARLNKIGQRAIRDAGYEMPHTIGHFVGLQVHDVGDRDGSLQAGMVLTVEPGIYIKGKLGVRIEDMVLVTSNGHRLLTGGFPRGADEIAAMVKNGGK